MAVPVSSISSSEVVWVSGGILTPLNKFVMPTLWMAALVGIPVWILTTVENPQISRGLWLLVIFILALTGWLMWLTVRLQRVGYSGDNLIVSNYFRAAVIPFSMVEAVESVWWYKGRMVRIRFRTETPFGSMLYYMPKWGPLRCLWASPDEELREIMRDARER